MLLLTKVPVAFAVKLKVFTVDLAATLVPFTKNSYEAPPDPEKVAVSPSHKFMIAGAFNEPGRAVKPGTGEGLTTTWKGSVKSSQVTLLRSLMAVLRKKVVVANATVGV